MMESVDPETGEFYGSPHQSRPELRICGHCCQVMQGFASMGDTWLCHPDEGLDCYSAVTLHKHPMRCTICDPHLAMSSTWDEVKARWMRDWTPQQWQRWDVIQRDGLPTVLGRIKRIRAMYRARKGGKR